MSTKGKFYTAEEIKAKLHNVVIEESKKLEEHLKNQEQKEMYVNS